MAINIAPKNRITKDRRKYFYRFYYENKRYTSKFYKTKAKAVKAEKEHIKELKNKQITKISKSEEVNEIHEMTFKELYDEFYEYKLDIVKQTTLLFI